MRTDLITPSTRLQRATKKLQERWNTTKQTWDDGVSKRFEEKHLEPIIPQLRLTLGGIHQLMQVLDEAVGETNDDWV